MPLKHPILRTMLQILSRYAAFVFLYFVGRSARHDTAPPGVSAARTHVDDIVGVSDDIQIMFDDDDRRAIVQQRLKDAEQHPHIQRVQPDGRFVEDENGIRLRFADLACQLEPLRLAAGQARRFLAEREIAEAELPAERAAFG